MGASFLTTLFFALSAVFANRTARQVGAVAANFARQWLAAGLLAIWAHAFHGGLGGAGLPVFILSGIVGFGFGDLAMFASFPLIGSRLAVLMVQCLAAPMAALMEWLWLGTKLTPLELFWGGVILAGVGLAIAPEKLPLATTTPTPTGSGARGGIISAKGRNVGLLLGLIAAVGQSGGAVLSRKANLLSQAAGYPIDGGTAAYQRILGGLLVVSAAYGIFLWRRAAHAKAAAAPVAAPDWKAAWPWIIANVFAGPVLGVSCYQRALATTPSAVVLPIVALTPLAVIPLAYFIEGERPSGRSLAGGALAVAAAAALARLQQ